jgi:hypothetical protein
MGEALHFSAVGHSLPLLAGSPFPDLLSKLALQAAKFFKNNRRLQDQSL